MHPGMVTSFGPSALLRRGPEAGSDMPNRGEIRHEPLPLGVGRRGALGPSPVLAFLLAVLVGLAVFAVMWRVRKTFGLKE